MKKSEFSHSFQFFLILSISLISLTNCQNQFSSISQNSISKDSSTQDHSLFSEKKIWINNSLKLGKQSVSIVIDVKCYLNSITKHPAIDQVYKTLKHNPDLTNIETIDYSISDQDQNFINQLKVDPCVHGVGPNLIYQLSEASSSTELRLTDPLLQQQEHIQYLKAQDSWQIFFSPIKGIQKKVLVAIIDTGSDSKHPDLVANYKKQSDGSIGYDMSTQSYGQTDDCGGHGTHVTGLIAAQYNNGIGVSGLMGQMIEILPIKIISPKSTPTTCSTTTSLTANAIRYAADQGADVINLSLGIGINQNVKQDPVIQDALVYAVNKGSFISLAAGNDGLELIDENTYTFIPAAYAAQLSGALAVASIDTESSDLSFFSNWSQQYIEIAAPGGVSKASAGLLSTVPTFIQSSGYARMRGTSMATPLISASAAMIKAFYKTYNQNITNKQIKLLITDLASTNKSLTGKIKDSKSLDLFNIAKFLKYKFQVYDDGYFHEKN